MSAHRQTSLSNQLQDPSKSHFCCPRSTDRLRTWNITRNQTNLYGEKDQQHKSVSQKIDTRTNSCRPTSCYRHGLSVCLPGSSLLPPQFTWPYLTFKFFIQIESAFLQEPSMCCHPPRQMAKEFPPTNWMS